MVVEGARKTTNTALIPYRYDKDFTNGWYCYYYYYYYYYYY